MSDIKPDNWCNWDYGIPTTNNKVLRTAIATKKFWDEWNKHKSSVPGLSAKKIKMKFGEIYFAFWEVLDTPELQEKRKELIKLSESETTPEGVVFNPPIKKPFTYLPYQLSGIYYMLNTIGRRPGVFLGDEPGLGKTLQFIGLMNCVNPKSFLVVCPKSLQDNWRIEFDKFSFQCFGIEPATTKSMPNSSFIVATYEQAVKHIEELKTRKFDFLAFDESHRLKDLSAKRTKELLKLKSGILSVYISGTPIKSRPIELYPIISNIEPSRNFLSERNFGMRYCNGRKMYIGQKLVMDYRGSSNESELADISRIFMVRRKKEKPSAHRCIFKYPESAKQRLAIQTEENFIRSLGIDDLEKAIRDMDYKLTSHISEISELRKNTSVSKAPFVVDVAVSFLEQDQDMKLCIAAHHKDVVDILLYGLQKYNPVKIDGSTKNRQKIVDKFQNDNESRVIILSILAAGEGLTLTRSSTLIHAEHDWTPSANKQVGDRIHRIGQTAQVEIIHVVLKGSIDEYIVNTVKEKQNVIDKILG